MRRPLDRPESLYMMVMVRWTHGAPGRTSLTRNPQRIWRKLRGAGEGGVIHQRW